jgi:hypothetical protein
MNALELDTPTSRRRWAVLALVAIALAATAFLRLTSAQALSGHIDDPNDTTSAIDLDHIAWTNDGSTVTYTVSSFDDYDITKGIAVRFLMNWDDANAGNDACVVAVNDANKTSGIAVYVTKGDGTFTGCSLAEKLGEGTGSKSGKVLTMSYSKSLLNQTGIANPTTYDFVVSSHYGGDNGADDRAPDSTTANHDLATTTSTSSSSTTSSSTTSTTSPSTTSSSTTSTTKAPTTTTTAAAATTTSTTVCGAQRLTVTPNSVSAGGQVIVSGTCYPANADFNVVLTSSPVLLGTVRSDANGAFSKGFTIPARTSVGSHTITVSGGPAAASATITVVSGGLVVTGHGIALVGLAGAVLFAGFVLLAGRRLGDENDDLAARL